MTIDTFQEFVSILPTYISLEERSKGVVYAAVLDRPLPAGTKLQFPGIEIEVKADAWLAFIDRVPMANWGHPARYLLLSSESRETWSFETRLPPFGPPADLRWRAVYKAPSIPDDAVASPQ